jgi:hypothetical protein
MALPRKRVKYGFKARLQPRRPAKKRPPKKRPPPKRRPKKPGFKKPKKPGAVAAPNVGVPAGDPGYGGAGGPDTTGAYSSGAGPYGGPPSAKQLPWNASTETQIGFANRNYNDEMAQLGQQDFAVRSDFGFDQEFANNPLTRANLLKKSYDQARTGAVNSMAARGQLYSGATSNQLSYADSDYNETRDREMKEYQGLRNEISQSKLGAARTRDESIAAAHAEALEAALGQELDSSQYVDDSYDAYGDGSSDGGAYGEEDYEDYGPEAYEEVTDPATGKKKRVLKKGARRKLKPGAKKRYRPGARKPGARRPPPRKPGARKPPPKRVAARRPAIRRPAPARRTPLRKPPPKAAARRPTYRKPPPPPPKRRR